MDDSLVREKLDKKSSKLTPDLTSNNFLTNIYLIEDIHLDE
jgi:hypothetical protein